MSLIEDAVFARAAANAGLIALIGTNPMRFWPELAVQDPPYPFCLYRQISAPREHAMGSEPGIVHGRYQIDCYALTRTEAQDLAAAVRACFSRWRGATAGVVVQDTFIDNEQDTGAELVNSIAVHRRITDLIIHYAE